jgi:hypothetical protein
MGHYYGPSRQPEQDKEPGGCMEVWIISRAVFGILAIPLLVLAGIILGIVGIVTLFTIHWLLGLAGIAAAAAGIAFYARWERSKFRSGGM